MNKTHKQAITGWMRFCILPAIIITTVALTVTATAAARKTSAGGTKKANPAMEKIQDDPNLPRVLLIGDSISIGYTVPVRESLKGKANVHRIPTNGGPTVNGLKNLDSWLGDAKWDVIHFNWGLHDLKYMGPNSENLADPKAPTSRQQVLLPEYEKNLRTLVVRLKKTGAKLIWCTTTPVAPETQGRVSGDEVKYNEAALRVMKEFGVAIDDLYAFAKPKLAKIQLPKNVHFTPEGYQELAGQVGAAIEKGLPTGK
jgi:hypothetical protein